MFAGCAAFFFAAAWALASSPVAFADASPFAALASSSSSSPCSALNASLVVSLAPAALPGATVGCGYGSLHCASLVSKLTQ